MTQLEKYEWCEFWWDEANDRSRPRVLLIGDSIAKGYRPFVSEELQGEVCVDMLATSKAVDHESLLGEIKHMLDQGEFQYEVIHFNNGLHGWHLSAGEYERGYERVLQTLISHRRQSRIAIGLTTPVTESGRPDEPDRVRNGQVLERNEAAGRLARKYGLAVHDLYAAMHGRSEYRVNDGYHYCSEGQQVQAKSVAAAIQSLLGR